jgi:Ca2+-binding EF-hand superfamily protein
MKKIIAITLSLVCIGFVSLAQGNGKQKRGLKGDLNGDGKIDREEFNKRASQQVKQIDLRQDKTFDRIDLNNDGFLDRSEMRQAREKRGQGRQGVRKGQGRHRNGNGQRPNANRSNEQGTIRQKANKRKMVRKQKVRTEAQFGRLDRNNNGVLNFREFKKGAKLRPNYSRSNAKRIFNRMDNNQDGILNAQEFAKAKKKVNKRRNKRSQIRRRNMRR